MKRARLGYVPALDGLRGLAIAAVVLYHTDDHFHGGFVGVDLFFCLSGYLITTLLLEEWAARGRILFRGFYQRRAKRLLPVALAAIVVCEIVLLQGGPNRDALGGLFAAFYVENLAHLLHPPVVDMVGHYWSLSQEEQFYLLWPPLLALLLGLRVRASWVTGFLIAAAVGVAVHRALLAHDWIRFYYAPDTRADGMLLGCALAFLWHMGKLRPSRLWTAMGAVSLAIFMATVVTLAIGQPSVGLYGITVANLASVALIGSLVGHPEGTVARVMSVQWLRWLGVISYSLYIWQPIVARMGNLTGWPMLAVAIPFAWLSYRLIEKPFRHSVAGRVRQSVEAQEIAESPAPVRLAARRADPPLSAGARRA